MVARGEVVLALVAFVCLGLTDFLRKKGSVEGANPVGYLLLETVVMLAVIPAAALLLEGRIPEIAGRGSIPYALISGVTIAVALIALMMGLSVGEGSVVIPISRLGLALAAVLSLSLLGETLTWTKALGLVFAVAAVFLLSR
ncbi:MAG: EamA family transporter [Candidatus Caldarchaeum sp.]|nr:EamA family transporter [Candidatus Caldarchaeum sp.]MDW8359747.1 EamA family transporter [Candidatus Caldarchaeum sp.]